MSVSKKNDSLLRIGEMRLQEWTATLCAAALVQEELLNALREIEWLVDGREDVDAGQPNVFMNIGVAARTAIAKARGGAA